MSDPHANCRYWGLAPLQCIRYHARLARFHARRARVHADDAARLSALAQRFAVVALVVLALSFVLQLIASVMS